MAGYIYEGFWTDWTKGNIWGLTLTLSPTNATVLTNSLTVFVTLCGVQLWTILRYILHQRGAPLQPEASTPHLNKQQLILRNAGSAVATAQLMLELAWTSRTSKGKPSSRAYTIGLSAIIYAVLFMAAGIASNKAISTVLSNGGSSVLLDSSDCGIWNQTYYDIASGRSPQSEEEFGLMIQHSAKRLRDSQLSLQYAQECYSSQASMAERASRCNNFKASTVGWQPFQSGSCPFRSQMCNEAAETVVLDTGTINSHDDLGINAKPADRLTYRRITTCAVLNGTSHVNGWNGTVENSLSLAPSSETAYAFYGPSLQQKTPWTYSYSNSASFYTNNSAISTKPYQVAVVKADPTSSENDFEPISALAQQYADLNLIFMTFTGTYLGSVRDLWFSAQKERYFDNKIPMLQKRYERDDAISTLGCTEQHQFCTSNNKTCTGFLAFQQVQDVVHFNAALTPNQNATFDRIMRAVADSLLFHIVQNLGATSTPLLASNGSMFGKSGAVVSQVLPDDQWKLELRYWHSVAMAQLQQSVVSWATGAIAAKPQGIQALLKPTEPQDVWFCKNMVVPSFSYQSFSVVSIILVVTSGAFITTVSLTVEQLAALLQKLLRLDEPDSRKHWEYDDLLELQHNKATARWGPPAPPKDDGYRPGCHRCEPGTNLVSKVTMSASNDHIASYQRESGSSLPSRHSGTITSRGSLEYASPQAPVSVLDEKGKEGWI
ncbi:hypothetical protein PMZ80_007161 [Knufia obscura]|uniref:Uncharacterized protein n=1 Tax=Knufia obscura TaxID=1635080 RepID=A0ABR0RKI8_9EURO|nr:hypothetical protein PMZ80_007161 [Knufia obscura]